MTSSNACHTSKNAEDLKAEGNALHQSRQYQAAYDKYSEAIKQNPENAVLWANRAASSLAMKRYMDAISDAEKATTIDPGYAKAWGRQGTANFALNIWPKSVDAFKKALECLPSGNLSKPDQVLKAQFEEGLKKAQEAIRRPSFEPVIVPAGSVAQNNLPWKRAMAMEPSLLAQRRMDTSALIVSYAFREFQRGLDDMKKIETRVVNGQQAFFGVTGGIEALSNAVLRERRVFHISDQNFFDTYNQQMMLEASRCNAWTTQGPQIIQAEAPKRLRTLGWGALRPALAVTVRGWIMRGFLDSSFNLPGSSPEFLQYAIDVIEWGARMWKNVPRKDRGTIFDPTFLCGVKSLYLNLRMEAFSKNPKNAGYSMEDIAKLAREIIEQDLPPPGPGEEIDIGFYSSFYVYPKAHALVILGWYYMQTARKTKDTATSLKLYAESAEYYTQGANRFHADDELHVSFLKYAIDAHWLAGTPLKVTLPICKQIREAVPAMKKIWEYASSAQQRDQSIEEVLAFENQFRMLLAEGKVTLEESGNPDPVLKKESKH
ncbi:hypothetical protein D9615_001095 [Tricholomella constricta]|uniref:Uncharacterized protein n=1 Tax=Tricholomella constricta TaxID=117010 RepID=A0A8H5HKL7_9AGAR|nr:hypothetical protein D9615_001095 [Tricholomella constricta]